MASSPLEVTTLSLGKTGGASPAESRYYVLVLFDIANTKKYRLLMRILKRYATRIQKSVFEAQLKPRQIKDMTDAIRGLMASERYYDSDDNVRIYRIAAHCEVTVLGTCCTEQTDGDIFI